MRALDRILGRLPRWQTAGLCLGLIALIGVADHNTGVERLLALLYLLPIALGAWYLGRSQGVALAILSAAAALVAGWSHVLAADLIGEAGFFVTVAVLVSRLQEEQGHDRASQQLIHGIINAIPGGVFWKDKNLIYLGCNAEFARGAGLADPKDIVGKNDYQMLWREQAEMYRADDREVIESGKPKLLIEEPSNTPEGTITTLLTSKIPLRDVSGEVSGVLGTYMDIAERIKKEEVLRAAQRLVEQMRDDLTHTMVHDLRSPLTTILATLEMVGVAEDLKPTLKDMTEIARSNARRQLGLIDSILSLSQLEQGAVPVERSSFSLSELVTEVVRLAAPRSSSGGIELVNDVAQDLPAVWADRNLLSRVLDNLVGNAIKFTPAGGRIRVEARSGADGLRVCVRDTGAGVPEELRPRLFQKFAAGTQKGRGSGLGLAFCRLAIEAHGGRIWLESEPGPGAAFVFTLPDRPI